jgi:hypothetical protein
MSAGAGGAATADLPGGYNQIVVHIFNVMAPGHTHAPPSIRHILEHNFKPSPSDAAKGVSTVVCESFIHTPAQLEAYRQYVTLDPDMNSAAAGRPLNVVCSGKVNPPYIQGNLTSITAYGGFVLKVFKAKNYVPGPFEPLQMTRSVAQKMDEISREIQDVPKIVSNGVLLGVCTVYVTDRTIQPLHLGVRRPRSVKTLYIATICAAPIEGTIKGVSARSITSTKEIARMFRFNAVTLEALFYCKAPANTGNIHTDLCTSWLHDYYISQGFVPDNLHITDTEGDEIMEYTFGPAGQLEKHPKAHKQFVANRNGDRLIAMTAWV